MSYIFSKKLIDAVLKRPTVELPKVTASAVGTMLEKKTVLVTGAAGSIGSDLTLKILNAKPEAIILLDNSETSLFEINRTIQLLNSPVRVIPVLGSSSEERIVEDLFKQYRPEFVFHTAAYKHVALAETNVREVVINNLNSTRLLSKYAKKYKSKHLIMVSTDKAVDPIGIMGKTKRACELFLSASHRNCITGPTLTIVRFGNVLGSQGSLLHILNDQLFVHKKLQVTHPEVSRFFMTISEATTLTLNSMAASVNGGIFTLEMGNPIKIEDIAKRFCEHHGVTVGKDIALEYIGLRPGERLHEQLYDTRYETLIEKDPFIRQAVQQEWQVSDKTVIDEFEALLIFSHKSDSDAIRRRLTELVDPNFVWANAHQTHSRAS